jgi:hypothetical protein
MNTAKAQRFAGKGCLLGNVDDPGLVPEPQD